MTRILIALGILWRMGWGTTRLASIGRTVASELAYDWRLFLIDARYAWFSARFRADRRVLARDRALALALRTTGLALCLAVLWWSVWVLAAAL